MKTEDENFDDLLKRKLGNEQFLFNEKYWDKARTLLDENHPKRKRLGFMIFMPVLFAVAIAAVVLNNKNNEPLAFAQVPSPASVNSPQNQHVQQEQAAAVNSYKDEQALVENANLPEFPSTLPAVAVNLPGSPMHGQTTRPVVKGQQLVQHEELPQAGELAFAAGPDMEQNPENTVTNTVKEDVMANPEVTALLVEPSRKADLAITGFQPSAIAFHGNKPGKNRSYKLVEAGANYYNPGAEAWSPLNVHLGIKYCLAVAPRLSLAAGLSYSRQHQNKGRRTYDKISYGFGESRETIGINTIRLDYLEVPVNVLYHLKGRYGLIAGASFNYLVQSADLIKQENSVAYNEKGNGYFAAFNRFDVQLLGGVTCTLNRNFMLSASYHYGLTDVTKNSVFKPAEFNNNKGVRLTLGYQLF